MADPRTGITRTCHPTRQSIQRGRAATRLDARKGVPNQATVEAKQACAAIVDDPTYRRNLAARARAGALARAAMECMLWHNAHGKPKERVDHRQTVSLARILAGDFSEEKDAEG